MPNRSADPEDNRTQDGPSRVRNQECAPRHVVHPRKEGCEDAQERNEPAEEHYLAAVAAEEILADFDAQH